MDLINFLIKEDLLIEYVEGFINGFTRKPEFYEAVNPIAFQYPHRAFYWESTVLGLTFWQKKDDKFRALYPNNWYTLNIFPDG